MQILLLKFLVCRPVYSLPKWHGARWSAWLRSCANEADLNFDELVLAIKPLRSGSRPLQQGEYISLLLVLADGWHKTLPDLLESLETRGGEGEFTSHKLALAGIYTYPDGSPLWFAGKKAVFENTSFLEKSLAEKLAILLELNKFSLVFEGPLRLALPSGHENRGKNENRFAPPDFLLGSQGIKHLLSHLRFMETSPDFSDFCLEPDPQQSELVWEDMRYNPSRKIALGGITGKLVCRGRPDYETARRLLAGEHFGAGKNARFGLGFWRIGELAPQHRGSGA